MNHRTMLSFLMLLIVGLMLATGCKEDHADHSDHEGHDHGPAKKQIAATPHDHDDHAGHDHGPKPGTTTVPADHADDHADHVDEVTLTPQAIARWGVRVEPASKQILSDSFIAPARVSFNLEAVAHVGSAVSGRVAEIKTRVGDAVNQGDALLVISSSELGQAQSDLLQKRAAITTAEASLRVARTLHDSAKALHEESQGIALSEVQQREAQWRAAEGELAAAKGAATAAENLLHLLGMNQQTVQTLTATGEINPHFIVQAPISGRVIERAATIGESVSPDRDALLVIADMTTLWVIADVPEPRIGQVALGSEATITVPALQDRRFAGVVTHIAPQLEASTRTISVRIEVRDGQADLRPGMFAQASISAGNAGENVLAVAEQAVQVVEGQTCVFVPVDGEPNTFAKRTVRLGRQVGAMVLVLEGLREGERYVASGSFILKADLGKAGAAHEH